MDISEIKAKIKDDELHRVVTSTLVYKPHVNNTFKFLIIQRASHKTFPGKWMIPGGGLTINDYIDTPSSTKSAMQWYGALETSLRREIKEEVNLEIGKPEFLVDVAFIRPDGTPVICFSYFAPYLKGEVMLDADCADYKWVTLEEARMFDILDGIWDEIRQVDEILKSRI